MDFQRAITVLCDARVQFVVVGGVAATLHGSASVTYDLDICYSRERSNLTRLASALAPFRPSPRGLPSGLPFVWDEVTLSNATILTLQTTLGEIDLLAEIAGLGDYAEVKTRSIAVQAFGRQLFVLDLPNLIKAKRAAGRAKDLAALPELEGLDEAQRE